MDVQLRTGATVSARPHDKMRNSSLTRGRSLITPRCQCSTGLGKHRDTCHHTDGGRVLEARVLAARFWESKLTSRGLSPQTHVAVREDMCVEHICGRTTRNSKGLGRAFLPSNRDCSKCHRTRGKTDKINLFKTLEINQRPVTIQGGFFLEKRPNLGGKGKPCSIFSWLFPSFLQLCSGLYTQQPQSQSSCGDPQPAARWEGKTGCGSPKAPPSDPPHDWNSLAATWKTPIRQACLFFWPDSKGSVWVCREQLGILLSNEAACRQHSCGQRRGWRTISKDLKST